MRKTHFLCQLVILTCKHIYAKSNEKTEAGFGQVDATLVNCMGKAFPELLALVIDIH